MQNLGATDGAPSQQRPPGSSSDDSDASDHEPSSADQTTTALARRGRYYRGLQSSKHYGYWNKNVKFAQRTYKFGMAPKEPMHFPDEKVQASLGDLDSLKNPDGSFACPFCPVSARLFEGHLGLTVRDSYLSLDDVFRHVNLYHMPFLVQLGCPLCKNKGRYPLAHGLEYHLKSVHAKDAKFKGTMERLRKRNISDLCSVDPVFNQRYIPPLFPTRKLAATKLKEHGGRVYALGPWRFDVRIFRDNLSNAELPQIGSLPVWNVPLSSPGIEITDPMIKLSVPPRKRVESFPEKRHVVLGVPKTTMVDAPPPPPQKEL